MILNCIFADHIWGNVDSIYLLIKKLGLEWTHLV